jgi:hypothetical protein
MGATSTDGRRCSLYSTRENKLITAFKKSAVKPINFWVKGISEVLQHIMVTLYCIVIIIFSIYLSEQLLYTDVTSHLRVGEKLEQYTLTSGVKQKAKI